MHYRWQSFFCHLTITLKFIICHFIALVPFDTKILKTVRKNINPSFKVSLLWPRSDSLNPKPDQFSLKFSYNSFILILS